MEETVEAEQMPAEELQALLRPLLLLFRYLVISNARSESWASVVTLRRLFDNEPAERRQRLLPGLLPFG